jgi:hypothetical protein
LLDKKQPKKGNVKTPAPSKGPTKKATTAGKKKEQPTQVWISFQFMIATHFIFIFYRRNGRGMTNLRMNLCPKGRENRFMTPN